MKELRICEVEGCNRKKYARNWCTMHYARWRKNGTLVKRSNRGRKEGYQASQQTKDKMSRSKLGQKHSNKTKDKISAGLMRYFRKKNSLAKELMKMYGNVDVAADWIREHEEEINSTENVNTLSRMRTIKTVEFPVGPAIEWLAIENITPELLVLAKEALEENEKEEGEK